MKKRIVMLLLGVFIALTIYNIIMFIDFFYFPIIKITGAGVTGVIRLFIEGGTAGIINISSPENKTYNFSIGDVYIIGLNASSSFDADSWWYTLTDLKHNRTVDENIPFSPNTTIAAVRWSNRLTVYANDSYNRVGNNSVTFFVFVPNSNPLIGYLPSELLVCEGSYLSIPPTYFNVTDIDEDEITTSIVPSNPFFLFPAASSEENLTVIEITSGTLNKNHLGGANTGSKTYDEAIYVNDGNNGTDYKRINITIIEINLAPSITNIGVQTVWTKGANSTFYKKVYVTDAESGNQDSGNLTFNITIINSVGEEVNLFTISSTGVMNFTANSSYLGIYNISVCVTDEGLINPHMNISLCNQDGSSLTSCNNFSLTVTDVNRAPQIVSYFPSQLSLNVSRTDTLYFNTTKYDPDGTIPDSYWYVDDIVQKSPSGDGSLFDEFRYTFGCGDAGNHTIKLKVTDGLLDSFVQWNLTVDYVACPAVIPPSGGGGGGGAAIACNEKWVCEDWQQCKNLKRDYVNEQLNYELMIAIKDRCSLFNWIDETCGFQIRECNDLNYCNKNLTIPGTIKECYFTIHPNCTDGIKNCHNGSCEILVDCGGPCKPCPTCSDGIKNQGEEEVDCGGPCLACLAEKPFIKRSYFDYLLVILVIVLTIVITLRVASVIELEREYRKSKKRVEA